MPNYMTQPMESGTKGKITYYRKQQSDHVSHTVSSQFTTDAKATYATAKGVDLSAVEVGTYKSGQGIPTGGTCVEI